ncbi:hypothetical protein MTR67_017663 [Solanum verrucosum]|uniref:Homeobox domain-containing protein n=1 Tax=Solanum verrucosum TaxID=315347 RepID=A0AAF0TS16_SOLVR|nr:hypothetical protein MTR67_017663 [Solanum verrucosum]
MTNSQKKYVGDSSTSQKKENKQSKCFRHTVEQVQHLKEFLKKCPHPDKDQLIQIGKEVGLNPKKIKTWIYNNKTTGITQIEKSDNKTLRTENERFHCENIAMKEAMKKIICPQCDSERASNLENLKEENQRLTDEVNLLFILFIFFPCKTLLICNGDKLVYIIFMNKSKAS